MKKGTTIITNSEALAQHLGRKCDGTHQHQPVDGGQRSRKAAIYTAEFCKAVVEGLKLHGCRNPKKAARAKRSSLKMRDNIDDEANNLEIGASDDEDDPLYDLNDDDYDAFNLDPDEDWEAWDDVKHKPLIVKEVRKARADEMGYVKHHQVYDYASIAECKRKTGAPPIDTKWVDTNKGDDA